MPGLNTSGIYADMASRGIDPAIEPAKGSDDCVRQCLDALQRLADAAEQAAQRRWQALADEAEQAWQASAAARIPDAPDWAITQRPGYREGLAASGIELIDDDCFEPSPAEWDRLEVASRDYPPSGGLD